MERPFWAVFFRWKAGKNDDLLDSFNLVKLTLLLRNKVNNKAVARRGDFKLVNTSFR